MTIVVPDYALRLILFAVALVGFIGFVIYLTVSDSRRDKKWQDEREKQQKENRKKEKMAAQEFRKSLSPNFLQLYVECMAARFDQTAIAIIRQFAKQWMIKKTKDNIVPKITVKELEKFLDDVLGNEESLEECMDLLRGFIAVPDFTKKLTQPQIKKLREFDEFCDEEDED